MLPILSFVGKSEAGKTTALEGVLAALKVRGYKIAVIKHAREFSLDTPGKNTWRLQRAGANTVIISAPQEMAVMCRNDHDLSPQEIARHVFSDADLILTEGFKTANTMKVEVHRGEQGPGLMTPFKSLLAVITDEPLGISVPQFAPGDTSALTDLVERWLKEQLSAVELELFVNGDIIPLNHFAKDIISRTLVGIVSSLKGVDEVNSLQLSLRRRS